MALAGLRGLLKPTYARGVISRAAESLLLDALELELKASGGFEHALLEVVQMAPHVGAKGHRQLAQRVRANADRLQCLRELDIPGARAAARRGEPGADVAAFAALYHALEKAGLVGEIAGGKIP